MISQTIRKFTFAAAAAVLMAGGIQAATNGDGWIQVAPAGGNFTVLMPGVPQHSTSPVRSGGLTMTMHTSIVDTGRYVYAVFYSDLPAAPASVRETLDAVRDGNARGGRVIDEKEFTFSGYLGKSLTIEKDGLLVYNRAFIVNNRLYQVMFSMGKSDPTPESANTFVTSFRLTN